MNLTKFRRDWKETRIQVGNLNGVHEDLWAEGGQVHDRSDGKAYAWSCGDGAKNPILALFPDTRQAIDFTSDRKNLFPNVPIYLLNELPLTAQTIGNRPLLLQRGETVQRWVREGGVLAATAGAVMAPYLLGDGELLLQRGEDYTRDRLVAWLERSGYQRSDLVWSPGQYILRGFIMDIFDPVHALPLRFEFFDETLECIRAFHPSTQKRVAELEDVELHSVAAAKNASFVSLLPSDTHVVLYEPQKIESQANSYHWLWEELSKEARVDSIPAWDEVFVILARYPRLRVSRAVEMTDAELGLDDFPFFKGDLAQLLRFCDDLREQGYVIEAVTSNPRFLDKESGPFSVAPFIGLRFGQLSSGFIDRVGKRAFLSDRELSGVSSAVLSTTWRAPAEWRDQLTSGQLVAHEDYGVAVFRGIEETVVGKETLDAITLEFAENKRLLVPALQFNKLTLLGEHEGDETSLDTLTGTRWRKSVEKDREKAKEEARVLMELFAKRELERREPMKNIDDLYQDFVAAFPHTETADQLKAVTDIMEDLNQPFPMDRLLVGDVGFGKTEVAMRAAFRAAAAGKQVCVLVPTTILAQQHYTTFTARMSGFSIKIGLLSRFVTKTNVTRTLEDAMSGAVDIVIGTHKLLQKGIGFRNLGLLVIDEEHRFGVMHKESLKRVYGAVDILSLSATPIPRTLALSLRGLRGISVLSTPPDDRLPVITYAGPWQISLVRKAIARELTRGGQIYFVTNRISRMAQQKMMLSAFFPDARIRIAHGQMLERELETTMLDFYSGKIDILLCTTIIESGLDVGTANTIIVDDSQELGLAQMYQLRGRVGRRGESAFAYFCYPENEALRKETVDRLEAISSLTGLGSGYSLARRDLEIRGAGEIGGTHQHGNNKTGGFHLFYRMLEQEIAKLRGQVTAQTELSFDQGGSIPAFYIPQDGVRVTLYRRLLKAADLNEVVLLREEMEDRFGPLPEPARYLADLTAIRNCGGAAGLRSVSVTRQEVRVKGDLKNIVAFLKGKRGWVILGDSALGPGGPGGVKVLVEAMENAIRR
ncbi:MAG: DEAD/DEAH box helicase [Synergistaceae bacterium]|jgi:transcription-repair coupling factor (superfamily II helicase)|nr:DEAD/DEAH box helicase [Synergistaceae bacterium]